MREFTELDVRQLLQLPADTFRVLVDIDWDGDDFKDVPCFTDDSLPAAILVNWQEPADPEELTEHGFRPGHILHEEAYSATHMAAALARIVDVAGDHDGAIEVTVNYWWLAYAMPAQVAA
jgi:hypothetical protein